MALQTDKYVYTFNVDIPNHYEFISTALKSIGIERGTRRAGSSFGWGGGGGGQRP